MRLGYSAISMMLCLWATLGATSLAQKSDTSHQSATTSVLAPATVSTPVLITQTAPVTKQSSEPAALLWAEVIEQNPDPKVVTDRNLLQRIVDTKLPWRVKDKATGIEMLLVPPGKFTMGMSSLDSDAQENEKPAHPVKISKPFYLGRTEVTQPQWVAAMDKNPSICTVENPNDALFDMLMEDGLTEEQAEAKIASATTVDSTLAVDTISWIDAQQFCEKTGLLLPTEAQWEYACRAGNNQPRYGELDAIAWNPGNANKTSHAVGMKAANALGFYDMLGNVWEWTNDWYEGAYYKASEKGVVDPQGPAEKTNRTDITGRVLRGGGWVGFPYGCRASYRYGYDPERRYYFIGFRVARNP